MPPGAVCGRATRGESEKNQETGGGRQLKRGDWCGWLAPLCTFSAPLATFPCKSVRTGPDSYAPNSKKVIGSECPPSRPLLQPLGVGRVRLRLPRPLGPGPGLRPTQPLRREGFSQAASTEDPSPLALKVPFKFFPRLMGGVPFSSQTPLFV